MVDGDEVEGTADPETTEMTTDADGAPITGSATSSTDVTTNEGFGMKKAKKGKKLETGLLKEIMSDGGRQRRLL